MVGLRAALLELSERLEGRLEEEEAREVEMSLYVRWRA